MPTFDVTSPVLGKNVGDTVELSNEDAQFYVQEGYLAVPGNEEDMTNSTSSLAANDPRLPPNAGPPAPVVPHLANEGVEGQPQGIGTSDPTGAGNTVGATQDTSGNVWDPADYTVDDVNDMLSRADDPEIRRVMDLEADGKGRVGILEGPYAPEDE